MLNEYANPYSLICSGYISFSRERLSANVQNNIVTFISVNNSNNTAYSDILREISSSPFDGFAKSIDCIGLIKASEILKNHSRVDNGVLLL